MEQRRKFLRGIGLFATLAAGASMATANSAPVVINKETPVPKTDPKIAKQLDEQGNSHLQLTAVYGEVEPPKPPPAINGYNFKTTDGSLYIQPNNMCKSHLTVESKGNIIMGTNYKKFVEGTEKAVSVKMMPGPDGHLYVNLNGEWKRLLTTA